MSERDDAGPRGLFARLREGLARSQAALSGGLAAIFTHQRLDAETIAELEEALIAGDVGSVLAGELAARIAKDRYDSEISENEIRRLLAQAIVDVLSPVAKPLAVDATKKPFVVLIAGVNGTGKTTTIGKLAAKWNRDGLKVMIAAGDTFRAAATEQLRIWAERAHVDLFAREPGADAASLAYDALQKARGQDCDVLVIDTAGRLQNKTGLMAELEKIVRVLKKVDPGAPHAAILVLDATTGQNALSQVEAFKAAVPLTGLIMTKLDGTARGGILVTLAHRFGLPIHFIGVGEGIDDLQPFAAKSFATVLTGSG